MPFDAAIVARHADAIGAQRWFGLTGLPFSDDERVVLAALAPKIARVPNWAHARSVADDVRANAAYDADAVETAQLKERALETVGPDALLRAMSAVVDRGLTVFFSAAERAVSGAGARDEELIRVAAGAAAEAVYRGSLAAAVAGDTHRFVLVEALFASGRWPIARIDDTLHVL
jgi:hypothetical protein